MVHLAVYHLMTEEEGRNGFLRWNDHICMFIKNNWARLLPYRKKTGSWQSTVAGVLSQYSPSIFKSGREPIVYCTQENFGGGKIGES